MKVLVIEDEYKIANSIQKGLSQEGFAVDIARDGQQGLDMAESGAYDGIILDRMLPMLDGMEICRMLRKGNIHTPILMLTARGQVDDKVEGLNAGADDYLTKPFAFTELLARVKAITRRPKTSLGDKLSVEDLVIDNTNYEVTRDRVPIALSRREFSLLHYLLRNKGHIVSKERIVENVWNYDADILPNTVEVYIGYLRQKVDKAFPANKPLIKTARGFGYKIG